jgi:UDP-galactose transporter B1
MIVSKPFPSTHPHPNPSKFPSALFLNFAQAIASCLSAVIYLGIQSWRDGSLRMKGLKGVLGIEQLLGSTTLKNENKDKEKVDVKVNGNGSTHRQNVVSRSTITASDTNTNTNTKTPLREKLPFLLLQVSIFQTIAGPIGFSALRHISYPTMVLGKVSQFKYSALRVFLGPDQASSRSR